MLLANIIPHQFSTVTYAHFFITKEPYSHPPGRMFSYAQYF